MKKTTRFFTNTVPNAWRTFVRKVQRTVWLVKAAVTLLWLKAYLPSMRRIMVPWNMVKRWFQGWYIKNTDPRFHPKPIYKTMGIVGITYLGSLMIPLLIDFYWPGMGKIWLLVCLSPIGLVIMSTIIWFIGRKVKYSQIRRRQYR